MKDILNRELKENDLVLGMVVSRSSDGIRFGVVSKRESVNWLRGWNRNYITTSKIINVYLIENPNEKELEIKQKIIDIINKNHKKYEETKAKKKALRRIPKKDLIIGESYIDDNNYKYVYLGKGKVFNSYTKKQREGYIYLSSFNHYNKDIDAFNYLPQVDVLKNPRKLVKVLDEKLTDYIFDKKEFSINPKGLFGNFNIHTLRFDLLDNE